jgi:SAM-dependent methyltransferase/uncharacterized protein YbaR (Trm112 family)
MNADLLSVLECPFCGAALQVEESAPSEWRDGALHYGMLHCKCCVYPVVDGIPYIQTGRRAQEALRLIGARQGERALVLLLEAEHVLPERLSPLLRDEPSVTFRSALELLSRDAEGTYLLYRFSDPTYLAGKALVDAVGQDERCWTRRVLDIGGGTGHLTRTLSARACDGSVILADVAFWKLWLARRFISPHCQPVCCDANKPLPFASDEFSFVFCSDAFHYVWGRRMLASEMTRLVGDTGIVALAHLHNAMVDNPSAGMPLDPPGYRHLFRNVPCRLIGDRTLLDAALHGGVVDLSMNSANDSALADDQALGLVASRAPDVFQRFEIMSTNREHAGLALNPLYHPEQSDGPGVVKRRFPSEYYEMEFAECKRYLPETVDLQSHNGTNGSAQFVMLDLPPRYS